MTKALLSVTIAVLTVGAGFVTRAEAGPADCASPCTVTANGVGYVSPVVLLANGGQVRFEASSGSHPTADTGVVECFRVPVGDSVTSVPVQFDHLGGGVVEATVAPGTDDQVTKTCGDATALADGSVLVAFHCEIHPQMNGVIRIGE